MKSFTNKDIENYYDQSEVHYRIFWKLKKSMGLHYGIWNKDTKNLADAVLNTNKMLMELGGIKSIDLMLDAGCGIGGSSIYVSKNTGCNVIGISLSKKQVNTATGLAKEYNLSDKIHFYQKDYTATGFDDNTFDIVWAIESMQTAKDKSLFYKEISRILKPGGKLLMADVFKPQGYNIDDEKDMQVMLNGWAMSDILSLDEFKKLAAEYSFDVTTLQDVSNEVKKSVDKIYIASILGMFGTFAYNLFRKATYFSRIHYTTGLAQKKAYYNGKWGYYLVACVNKK